MILETNRKAAEKEPQSDSSKSKTKRKLGEEFIMKIKNNEKNINGQIFKEYFFLSYSIMFTK